MEVFVTGNNFKLPQVSTKTGEVIEYPQRSLPFIVTNDGSIHEHASDWLYDLVIRKGLDEGSAKTYAYRGAEFLRWCSATNKNYIEITRDDIGLYLFLKRNGNYENDIEPIKNNTSNAINTTLRSFYKRLKKIGVITEIPNSKNIQVYVTNNEGMFGYLGNNKKYKSDLDTPLVKLRPKWKKLVDIITFLENCSPLSIQLMAYLMLELGLRRAEAALINIDIINKAPIVLDDYEYMIVLHLDHNITPTKGKVSRYVLISPFLLNSVRDYISSARQFIVKKTCKRLKLNEDEVGLIEDPILGNYHPLFLSNRGTAYALDGINVAFRRASEKSGFVDDPIHPHMLRHSLAKHLKDRGWTPYMLSQVLGHSTFLTTEKCYWHTSDDEIREDIRVESFAVTQILMADEKGLENLKNNKDIK